MKTFSCTLCTRVYEYRVLKPIQRNLNLFCGFDCAVEHARSETTAKAMTKVKLALFDEMFGLLRAVVGVYTDESGEVLNDDAPGYARKAFAFIKRAEGRE